MINNKIVITSLNDKYILIGISDDKTECMYAYDDIEQKLIPGAILNARVEKVNAGIDSCFIRIGKDKHAYLEKAYKCETVLPVLYKKEPVNDKKALFSDELSIGGRFAVVYEKGPFVKSSAKFSKTQKEKIKAEYEEIANELQIGILLRSESISEAVSKDDILCEIRLLANKLQEIRKNSYTRNEYTILYSPVNQIIKDCEFFAGRYDDVEIITDCKNVYNLIKSFIENMDEPFSVLRKDNISLRLYEDSLLPLAKLYAFEQKLSLISSRVVNLKNGASIVFDKTEALTAIDVNSSRCKLKEKDKELFTLELNKHAFYEICHQIILRNISGIIIVDFVNMKSEDSYIKLTEYINELVKKDHVKTVFHGFTSLGLGEFSRQKIRSSFTEQLR